MSERILVTGAEGMVGSRLMELYGEKGLFLPVDIDDLDITDEAVVEKFVKGKELAGVVHLAAFTDVGGAEKQRGDRNGACWRVNVEGTRNLVEAMDGGQFIYVSTDMVFSGSEEDPGPYEEDHVLEKDGRKLTWYGITKAEGEKVVLAKMGVRAAILRIVYPVRARFEKKLDYFRKVLALFDEGKLYPMFSDQQVSVTFIDEACEAIVRMIERGGGGVFHASSRDVTTPHEIFSYLIEKARERKGVVEETMLEEFLEKTGAEVYRYPKYGGLRVERTEKELGMKFSSWREVVERFVEQLRGE
jgi:dTDP-4-dehydrorhamnose reductase